MGEKRIMSTNGVILTTRELEEYLEKIGTTHNLTAKSWKETYPIPRLLDNYALIKDVYEILNEHVKQGISIHPAGEWILDNFYIIEETVKSIKQELTLKKHINFIGIKNGINDGFARVYVLASEIVNCTDNKIETENLENTVRRVFYPVRTDHRRISSASGCGPRASEYGVSLRSQNDLRP